ncbi:transcription factor LHW-like protein isoform X1 [Cinnamomum micranthum f. kanehirae]|uniref:Transcription factor LHW-like protein isoform X1 n=1 Tax=Cinnamomum micranthum f. kanehirae TaxID=337451 RepID=A0A443NWU4_9MAGN|nr:transcription factor LHW-like protein isoform X1 [Cinnamomum micranthum f. kanehirae]
MEGGLPMLNCLLQYTLRSLCASPSASNSYSSNPSKWVYAVFWRILPRNYPPPKWDNGGGALDRSKANRRNWILVWEDGFCDFFECQRAGSSYNKGKFGADVFFKMSHEVYSYGEGLMGKIAADNSHKWIFREMPSENESNFFTSWNGSRDSQPKAWESQFNSGIQTIAIIAVREGIIQLGSLNKVNEDLNLVISIQRKFNYLQSIPGVFAIQRPYAAHSQLHTNTFRFHNQTGRNKINQDDFLDGKCHVSNRSYGERLKESSPSKSINLGCNSPQNRGVFWSVPPHLPSMSCSLGALLSKLPCVVPSNQTSIESQISAGHDITLYTHQDNMKMAGGFNKALDSTPGVSFRDQFPNTMNDASALGCLDIPESKPKTQECNPSQSWEEPTLQLEFKMKDKPDEQANPPYAMNNIVD